MAFISGQGGGQGGLIGSDAKFIRNPSYTITQVTQRRKRKKDSISKNSTGECLDGARAGYHAGM